MWRCADAACAPASQPARMGIGRLRVKATAIVMVVGAGLAYAPTIPPAPAVPSAVHTGAAGWRSEAIPGPSFSPLSVSFDAVGNGLVTGLAARPEPPPRPGALPEDLYVAGDRFDPTGGWAQTPNLPIASSDSQTYLYGDGRAQQIGSEGLLVREKPYELHFRVLYADATAQGVFGAPHVLDQDGDLIGIGRRRRRGRDPRLGARERHEPHGTSRRTRARPPFHGAAQLRGRRLPADRRA